MFSFRLFQKIITLLALFPTIRNQGTRDANFIPIKSIFRGFYAADFVLEKNDDGSARPYLLEINFNPSLSAMLKVDPDFMNKVFKTMFCDDKSLLPLIALHA
jgi:hypothetical protein